MTAIIVKSTTKKGQNMLQSASKNEGFSLMMFMANILQQNIMRG